MLRASHNPDTLLIGILGESLMVYKRPDLAPMAGARDVLVCKHSPAKLHDTPSATTLLPPAIAQIPRLNDSRPTALVL